MVPAMNLIHSSPRGFHIHPSINSPLYFKSTRFSFTVRSSSLPFPLEKSKYHKELEAASDVVQKACRLCVHVKKSLFSSDGRIVEKNDQSPVTVADFSVQALISLELSSLFPSIPLVAEEDSAVLRSSALGNMVVDVVNDAMESGGKPSLTPNDVFQAIDRGGKDAFRFGQGPATYWVLDPIDGTRGFLKGSEALYVVGLALVINGEIAVGVMGCPNWQADTTNHRGNKDQEDKTGGPGGGIIMIAHVGCGTWTKKLENTGIMAAGCIGWDRCSVDSCRLVHKARFCIPESITWESLPVSRYLSSRTDADGAGDGQVHLLPTCCGSLCKYLMVASGRASVFIQRTRAQTVIKVWDHAVGVICVLEAGGQVTDWEGSELDLAADQVERRVIFPPGGVLASNGNLHKQILGIISANSLKT